MYIFRYQHCYLTHSIMCVGRVYGVQLLSLFKDVLCGNIAQTVGGGYII